MVAMLDLPLSERPIFDSLHNRQFLAFLSIEEAFVNGGGKRDMGHVAQIGEQLS